MTLWAFIIPVLLLAVTATIAHFRRLTYWPAVRLSFVASAAWVLPYFVALRVIFFDKTPFQWTEPFRFILIALIGGLISAALSMLIGVTFVADRRIAARDRQRDVTP